MSLADLTHTQAELLSRLASERKEKRAAVSAFADCVATSNVKTIGAAIQRIDALFEWPAALRAALRLPRPASAFGGIFLTNGFPTGITFD